MGTTTTWYTSAAADGQDVYSSTISTSNPLTVGYPSSQDYRIAFRVQPNLSQSGQRVVVDAFTATIQAANGDGDGAWTAGTGIHDGDCPDLSANDIAFGYSDIGNSVSPVSASSHNTDDTWTTPSLLLAAQAWFDRAGYASDDYLGIWWTGGDSAKDEYWSVYNGDYATQANRPRCNVTYHIAGKWEENRISNANWEWNRIGSDNVGP